jgi:hypothetical protein
VKRTLTAAALVLLFNPIQANAFEMRPECRYRLLGGPGWSNQNVHDTAVCAAKKNRLSVRWFLSVVSCESDFRAFPGGSHHGPMQYVASTFYSHFRQFPDYVRWFRLSPFPDQPRVNILIGARYMRIDTNPWSCA